jgi:hemolysin activation/secretion protein
MLSRLRLSCGLLLAASVGLAAESPAPAPPQQHFDIQEYRVLGNTVLPTVDIERLLYPLLGENKTLTDVNGAKTALEKLYHDRGFGTVFVDIPPQDVTDGVVRLRAVEGRIERSEISGARYFSERDVIERLPAAKVGTVLNIADLQKQLAPIGTETADRAVVPVLKAGSAPGTVDVAFKVNDQLPLHGSVELNNQQTVDTRPLRAVLAMEYDNLFGTLDRISFQYQGTPQQVDQVKVFAANYAFHPWSSGLQASLLYINSDSNVATVGTLGVLGKGQIGGLRLTYPFVNETTSTQSLTLGFDYKHFRNTVNVDATTALDTPIHYVNLSLAYTGVWRSSWNITSFSLSGDAGPRGFANNPIAFANDRYKGRSNYFYTRADLTTLFTLPKQFSLKLRVAGQGALEPIISNENYSIAGADGVRGYLESEELGDSAIRGTVQFQSPAVHWHDRQLGDAYVFFDGGRTQVIDPLEGQRGHTTLRSWGAGFDFLPGQKITGSLTWAKALATGSSTDAGDSRALFVVHGSF